MRGARPHAAVCAPQVTQLLETQREMCLRLEEVRLQLARRQEREAVEARLAIEIEKSMLAPRRSRE